MASIAIDNMGFAWVGMTCSSPSLPFSLCVSARGDGNNDTKVPYLVKQGTAFTYDGENTSGASSIAAATSPRSSAIRGPRNTSTSRDSSAPTPIPSSGRRGSCN
jgi:hypothetical protein